MTLIFRRAALALLITMGVGCDSPVGTVVERQAYELKSIAGLSLPAVSMETPDLALIVVSDTLRFIGPHDGLQVRNQLMIFASDPSNAAPERIETRFNYRVRSGRLEITFICPPNALALCIKGPHLFGGIRGRSLELDTNIGQGEHVYEMIRD